MQARSDLGHAGSLPSGIVREITPLSLWGGDTRIYQSIIALSALALPVIASVNLYTRGTPSWPQLGAAGAIFTGALLCSWLARRGRRDVAAALLIGVLWFTVTIYAFNSGYGMHSAAVFVYLPCVLYTSLFFGLTIASVELAFTISVLVLMYYAEQRGNIAGAAAFIANGTNFNFLVGVVITSIGTLAVGVAYHRRVEREAARVVAAAEQRRAAMELAQDSQAQLQTAHARLQQMNDDLAQRGLYLDREMARALRDIGLYHDAVSREIPASLRALREAIARPDEQTEARLQRELAHLETVCGALADLGHGEPAVARDMVALTGVAQEAARKLREEPGLAQVRVDIDAGLRARGDPRLLALLLQRLLTRAARACRAEPEAVVHFGSGSLDGRAMFFVHDNGSGMDRARPDDLRQALETGLAGAQNVIERHGGDMVVDFRPGKGTTVFFSLPAA
jgi:signal transduction histidine kinase